MYSILTGLMDGGSPDEASIITGNNIKNKNKKAFLKAPFLMFNLLLVIKTGIFHNQLPAQK